MSEMCKIIEYIAKFVVVFLSVGAIVALSVFGYHAHAYAQTAANLNEAPSIQKAVMCGGAKASLEQMCIGVFPRDNSVDETSEHAKTRAHIDRSLASSFEAISEQNRQLVKECRSDASERISKLGAVLDAYFLKMDGAQRAECSQLYAEIHALNVTMGKLNATDKALTTCQTERDNAVIRLRVTNGVMSFVSLLVFSGALFAAVEFKQVYAAMVIVSIGVLDQILSAAEWIDPHWIKFIGSLGMFCLCIVVHMCTGGNRNAPTTTTTNNYIYHPAAPAQPPAAPAQGTNGPSPVVFQPSGRTTDMNTWDKMD
jgi:hypothetical protein